MTSPSARSDQLAINWSNPVKARWFVSFRRTVAASASSVAMGCIACFSSAMPGEGVRSGKTRPSQMKEPSCGFSPKSPP